MVDAAEQTEQRKRIHSAAPRDAVLAVGREDEVIGPQRTAGADLRGFLAEELCPDAELTVPLQGGRLGVDAPGQHHVAVEAPDRLVVEVEGELRVLHALALGSQELHQIGAAVRLVGPEDLADVRTENAGVRSSLCWVLAHLHSFVSTACGVSAAGSLRGARGTTSNTAQHTRGVLLAAVRLVIL